LSASRRSENLWAHISLFHVMKAFTAGVQRFSKNIETKTKIRDRMVMSSDREPINVGRLSAQFSHPGDPAQDVCTIFFLLDLYIFLKFGNFPLHGWETKQILWIAFSWLRLL